MKAILQETVTALAHPPADRPADRPYFYEEGEIVEVEKDEKFHRWRIVSDGWGDHPLGFGVSRSVLKFL